MDIDLPVYWQQGQFLQPQHFQLQDISARRAGIPFQMYGAPYFYGVGKLEIQESALNARVFEIAAGDFMFADGTFVSWPGNAVLESRSFDAAWTESEKPFNIFLGLKKLDASGANVSVRQDIRSTEDVNTRFITTTDPEEIKDVYGDGPPAHVKRIRYVLKIFWEHEMPRLADYELLPVARLIRDGEEIKLSPRYAPPCLVVSASQALKNVLTEIRDLVVSRCRQLEEYKTPREAQSHQFELNEMIYLLALRSLNRYVPWLYQLLETDTASPWFTYGILRQIVGEMSSFSDMISSTGESREGLQLIPPYRHDDLFECYNSTLSVISRLADEITTRKESLIRFEFEDPYYIAEFPSGTFKPNNQYFLILVTKKDPNEVIQEVQTLVKSGVREALPNLIARSIPGIRLDYLPVPPPGLPRRPNSIYFKIDTEDAQWDMVEKKSHFALYWDNAPEDLAAEIIIR